MTDGRAALVLTGGGARAAYQVGALIAIRDVWGRRPENPFPIICGTSAGAVNAAASRRGGPAARRRRSGAIMAQYRGTAASRVADQASMPPATLATSAKPCCARKAATRWLRAP